MMRAQAGGLGAFRMEKLENLLDWPPVWMLGGIGVILVLGRIGFPFGFGAYGPGLGVAFVALGIWLLTSALLRMRAHATTFNPRGAPTALVTDGVFAISRNPIYLADVLILLGFAFWADAVLGLLVAAGFVWVISDRFIAHEEELLAESFGDEAAVWFNRVRRWI